MKTIAFKKQSGFTLIEVMVALFVLTIGMLGSTSMMLRAQLKAQETNTEATAAQRVWNIAELLRSNVTDINSGGLVGDAQGSELIVKDTDVATGAPCIASGCSGTGLLAMTKYLIALELDTYLKNKSPVVTIKRLSGTAEKQDILFDIVLTWKELGKDVVAGDPTYDKSYQMIFQP